MTPDELTSETTKAGAAGRRYEVRAITQPSPEGGPCWASATLAADTGGVELSGKDQ